MKKYANQQLIVKRDLLFYTDDVSNRKRDIYRFKKYMTRASPNFFQSDFM